MTEQTLSNEIESRSVELTFRCVGNGQRAIAENPGSCVPGQLLRFQSEPWNQFG